MLIISWKGLIIWSPLWMDELPLMLQVWCVLLLGDYGWSASRKHIFPLGQTHLLPFMSCLLPSLSAWLLKTEHSQPSSPPSCHTCWVHEKLFFCACLMWGQASLGFSALWTVRCWHHIAFQLFPEDCILLAVVSAVGTTFVLVYSQTGPFIPATFNRAHWLLHPLLSLAGQNQSSVGRLTAGMLSVEFPPPRQNCDLLGVSFSVVWPLNQVPAPRSSSTASSGLPRCSAAVVWSQTSIWDDLRMTSVKNSRRFFVERSSCIQVCLLSWYVLRRFLFLFEAQKCS